MADHEGVIRPIRRGPNVLSTEDIDSYVKELLYSAGRKRNAGQNSFKGNVQQKSLTVEYILEKVYGRFFNQSGQSPFPDGLPFALKQIPSIARIAELQLRATALVQSAVATRPVVTLHELELEVCSAEGVSIFAELGLGDSLTALPFVQHAFNLRSSTGVVAPITSDGFLQFLLFHADAEIMLTSGGDAGDAVRAFAQFYKNGYYTPLQLGIHIQHFSWLLRLLRQETGRTSAFISQIVAENIRAADGRALLYTRVVEALHGSMILREKETSVSRKLFVPFSVRAPVPEAESMGVPLALWNKSGEGPAGGVCLYGVLQTDPISAQPAVPVIVTNAGTAPERLAPHESSAPPSNAVPSAFHGDSSRITNNNDVGTGLACSSAFAYARKRQRRVVADDSTTIVETPSFPKMRVPLEPPPFDVTTSKASTVSLPTLSLQDAMSVLRCLVVMQSAHHFSYVPTVHDFTVFKSASNEVVPLFLNGSTSGISSVNSEASNSGTFHVSLEKLLTLLGRTGAPNKLYDLYRSFKNTLNFYNTNDRESSRDAGNDCGQNGSPASLMFQCVELGMSDLLFVPVVGTDSLLPLAAARSALSGRVLLSGYRLGADLLDFHPLHIILSPVFDNGGTTYTFAGDTKNRGSRRGNKTAIVIVDSLCLFGCKSFPHSGRLPEPCEKGEHEVQQLARKTLEDCGVITRVPEEWFENNFLAEVLKRQVEDHHNQVCTSTMEDLHMALRMLTLYWWLMGLCFSKTERHLEKVTGLLNSLNDTRWIPYITPGKESNRNMLREDAVRWCTPRELFPSIQCFIASAASELLNFAPRTCVDLIELWKQYAMNYYGAETTARAVREGQFALEFLNRWVPIVRNLVGTSPSLCNELRAALFGMPRSWNAEVALRVLRSLRIGMHVSVGGIRHLVHCIASDVGSRREVALRSLKKEPLLPLPPPHSAIASNEPFIIGELATCDTVHWFSLTECAKAPSSSDCKMGAGGEHFDLEIFDRSICFLGDDLCGFFRELLGVSPVPTVASWVATAQSYRHRVSAGSIINTSLTELFLHALTICCTLQYREIVSVLEKRMGCGSQDGKHRSSPQGVAQNALQELLDRVPANSKGAYIFPLNGKWRSGAEGLFFCGSYYCGFDEVALQAVENGETEGGSSVAALPALKFTHELSHYAVATVLQRMGLTALEDCTEKIVTFSSLNTDSSAELHRMIGECVPRVQGFMRAQYPLYYELVDEEVRHRLENFGTTLAKDPVLKEVVRYRGKVYSMVRTIRCTYIPQHHCIYGVDEQFTPSVGAEAVADIFVPRPDAEVRRGLLSALQEWFNCGSLQFYGGGFSCETLSSQVTTEPHETRTPSDDPQWHLSAASVSRFRDHFPLGREGFSLIGKPVLTAGKSSNGARSANLKVSLWGDGDGYSVRSLPKWSCEFFGSAHEVIRAAVKRIRRGDDESNTGENPDVSEEFDAGNDGSAIRNAELGVSIHMGGKHHRRRAKRNPGPMVIYRPEGPLKRYDTHDYSVAAERFVYEKLCNETPTDVEVVWVNEHSELGVPYDILLLRRIVSSPTKKRNIGELTGKEDVLAFIEVKSTCTNTRRDFEMSLREVLFAARFGRAYKVYRVFRASTSAMREMHVEVLEDIITMWHQGKLTLTGEVKVMPTGSG
ncbi:hypothetical protein DPX39_070066700 [Trypanosoma brucei equiperdum]|uniref:Protein NO VEIN C-terminal domain-containing protein n=1 Tax=Trypanosoma brucei equiperdum TaxID=630700 RepID=A0A3L6L8Z1_9TRYP|nr:hypothetical protein DPX39_070066700 [Trypanosoma brucei equiperdum]